jgi:hypothetical protein
MKGRLMPASSTKAEFVILALFAWCCTFARAQDKKPPTPARLVEQIVVTGHVDTVTLASPDPSQRVLVREELLDANPGRPGAPVSLPGLPIETASGGIKAPQYFVPGVAGDHGEPIAQYIAVGGYLVPNNLSANAHGNGYADPNIFIASALAAVSADGGAFNVLEGNHAVNLAATYEFKPQPTRFVTLSGDYRDVDIAAGLARHTRATEWLALEASYGNGLLDRLEHRQQYKWNATRSTNSGRHALTLMSLGYYGSSYLGGLVPLGMAQELRDTVDPRQRDQTHSAIAAASDHWTPRANDDVYFSGFVRSTNLALFSNFGEGLIRQSEFRTVEGAEARDAHRFGRGLDAMGGLEYNEDDPRRDDLDHYLSTNAGSYGAFVPVMANTISIRALTPYAAVHGSVGAHVRVYIGSRYDEIGLKNTDLLNAVNSFSLWRGFPSPKATIAWSPGALRWLPSASFSMGQAFFTQDPRIGVTPGITGVLEKDVVSTDLRVTLGRTTTTSTLAKIDPDTGLAEEVGPELLRFVSISARRQWSFGSVQAVLSKADARDRATGLVTPEAPRTIFDTLAALDRLPMQLRVRSEYEYVGHKLLDTGGFEAVPVKEFRLAVVRPVMGGRMEVGANGMLARGYTGQTTETFAPNWLPGMAPPGCNDGVNGIRNDFDCGSVERSVGVRMPSYVGASVSWRFSEKK